MDLEEGGRDGGKEEREGGREEEGETEGGRRDSHVTLFFFHMASVVLV